MLVATEYYITTAARLFLHLLHFAAVFHVNRETAKRTGLYNPRDDVVGLLPPVPHRAAAAAATTTRPGGPPVRMTDAACARPLVRLPGLSLFSPSHVYNIGVVVLPRIFIRSQFECAAPTSRR